MHHRSNRTSIRRCMKIWFVLAALVILGTGRLNAQDSMSITGLVLDSASSAPLENVTVRIGLLGEPVNTDDQGVWIARGVAAEPGTLVLEKSGYVTRMFQFDPRGQATPEIDVGVVLLSVGENPTAPVVGRVYSGLNQPVARVSVSVDDRVSALTDEAGRFEVAAVPIGIHSLAFRRIGYVPKTATIQTHGDVEVSVTLVAMPVELEEIVVDADRVVYAGRIREFYRRRERGMGRFITRWDIEKRNPMFVSDLFRTIPGVRLVRGRFGRNEVVMSRNPCRPQIYLDGMPLEDVGIDDFLMPDHIEGIEVYTGVAAVPIEFNRRACGAIVIWTR